MAQFKLVEAFPSFKLELKCPSSKQKMDLEELIDKRKDASPEQLKDLIETAREYLQDLEDYLSSFCLLAQSNVDLDRSKVVQAYLNAIIELKQAYPELE